MKVERCNCTNPNRANHNHKKKEHWAENIDMDKLVKDIFDKIITKPNLTKLKDEY